MAYTVHEQTREVDASGADATVVRTLLVTPYSEHVTALADLLGYIRSVGGTLVRNYPHRDPWMPWLWCTKAKAVPFGGVLTATDSAVSGTAQLDALNTAASALVTATYTPMTIDRQQLESAEEKDLATQSWEFSARQMRIPNRFMRFKFNTADTTYDAETVASVVIPQIDYRLTRQYCLRKPTDAILKNLGKINKSEFRIGTDNYPAGTLRFEAASSSQKMTVQGLRFFELTYCFSCVPLYDTVYPGNAMDYVGWNRVFNSLRGYWEEAVWANNSTLGIYRYDEDTAVQTLGGATVSGFDLLFHRKAT
jgi:hypothetical protein